MLSLPFVEALPRKFGRYQLLELLATGGMAYVYRARLEVPGGVEKELVIKQVLPHLVRNRDFIDMFIDEARITLPLSHGNIVQVYEFGQVEQDYYLAMEYVRGRNLETVLGRLQERQEGMPVELAMFIAAEVARGLEEMAEELFPACLEVSLRRELGLQAVEALAGRLQRLKGVEEVQYGGRWLQRARALLRLLKGTIWILGGILLLVTLFITANTLRLIFYRRQEEVEILRLVGATEGFIRYPFLIEGALQGLLGAGLSVMLLALLHPFISMALGSQAIPYLPSFRFLPAPALLSLLSLGFLSGLIGGAISCTGS